MDRIDAQHDHAPPRQDLAWFGEILHRNRFGGAIFCPAGVTVEEALQLARPHAYIRRVIPRVAPEDVAQVPGDARIVSVRLDRPTPEALVILAARGLHAEIDAASWPLPYPLPTGLRLAIDGLPPPGPLPEEVYIKLTGFRLPPDSGRASRLRALLAAPGPDRLMYASNWPNAGGSWKETMAAFTQSLGPMPLPIREQILGGTARAFYGLG